MHLWLESEHVVDKGPFPHSRDVMSSGRWMGDTVKEVSEGARRKDVENVIPTKLRHPLILFFKALGSSTYN